MWPEERNFSAWLLAHSADLAEVLHIEIELNRAEQPVGDFFADLVGRDVTHSKKIVVENQLELSDHKHLGQVLLYAAGVLDAGTVVWIARGFRQEHLQALEMLNDNMEGFHFFPVQVSGEPPHLSRAVQPADKRKRGKQAKAGSLTPRAACYLRFWARFVERLAHEHPDWIRGGRTPAPQGNWIEMPSEIGSWISAAFGQGRRLKHELAIIREHADANLALFHSLESQRDALETSYGRRLMFEEKPGRKSCSVTDYLDNADVTEEDRHEEFISWFFDCGARLRRALERIRLPGS
jgi:hypothetical protein